MASHSSILAWRTPGTKEPGELQSIVLQSVSHSWATDKHKDLQYNTEDSTQYSVMTYVEEEHEKYCIYVHV